MNKLLGNITYDDQIEPTVGLGYNQWLLRWKGVIINNNGKYIMQAKNNCMLAVTICVDPTREFNGRMYKNLSRRVQIGIIKKVVRDVYLDLRNKGTLYELNEWHFEFHESGTIHAHGFFTFKESYSGYSLWGIYIAKKVHNLLGRKGVRSDIGCRCIWSRNEQRWLAYIRKDAVNGVYIAMDRKESRSFMELQLSAMDLKALIKTKGKSIIIKNYLEFFKIYSISIQYAEKTYVSQENKSSQEAEEGEQKEGARFDFAASVDSIG